MSQSTSLLTEDQSTAGLPEVASDLAGLCGRALCEGRFLVEEVLGHGAQGAVYRIRREAPSTLGASARVMPSHDRYVPHPQSTPSQAAMKVMFPDPSRPAATARFIAEYRVAARLRAGPFVCAYEMFEDGPLLCYTMDYMPGGTLAATIGTPLPVAVAVGLGLDVLAGLDILHSQGIVHRDIKHHNILLEAPLPSFRDEARVGDERLEAPLRLPRAKLADFGISDVQDMVFGDRVFDTMLGTPYFMAPEFGVRDTVDARVDLYAVGVLLFMLLTGMHPRSRGTSRGSTEIAVKRQLSGQAIEPLQLQEIANHVPAAVVSVVSHLLEPDPNRRLRTAALAFEPLYAWFVAHKHEHKVELSHPHVLYGRPYLAAAALSGRRSERAAADAFLSGQLTGAGAVSGHPSSVLVISGEPGIGKSRLTNAIRRSAQRMGFTVHSLVAQRAQGAFDALERLKGHFHESCQAAMLAATPEERATWHDPHHQNYIPDSDRDSAYALLRQTELPPEDRPARSELKEQYLLDRFAAEVRSSSYQTPLCFCIEDGQWLDAETLKYLFWCMRFLASSRSLGMPVRVAWVLNHRLKDPDGDCVDQIEAQLVSLTRLEAPPLRIELSPFSQEDATELVASMLQLPAESADVARLVAALALRRALSPLYIEQSLWALFASGSLYVDEPGQRWQGQWKLDAESLAQSALPGSVRDAIGERASRLSAETLRVLGAAAVSGKESDVEVLARALELDADRVLTALEQAGRTGFVVQEQGHSRLHVADGREGDIRYRFSHDRYRESILSRLDAGIKEGLHGQLVRAITQRWGEGPKTYPMLAEHAFGAGEYGPACQHAMKVARQAQREGNHERAADYFRLALSSHGRAQQKIVVGEELLALRDQSAESMAAVGRFEEANEQLRILLTSEHASRHKRLDYQRRIADSYFIQHDPVNAVEQFTGLLQLLAVGVGERGLKKAALFARGGLAILLRGPLRLGINRQPAPDPHLEMLITQTLFSLAESANHIDFRVSLEAIMLLADRVMTKGLHPFSSLPVASFSFLCASQGLHGLSLGYQRLVWELFPDYRLGGGADPAGPAQWGLATGNPRGANSARTLTYALLLLAKFYRGELAELHDSATHDYIRQGIPASDMTANIHQRRVMRLIIFFYCLFTGRISGYQVQIQMCINMYRQARISRHDRILTPHPTGVQHELAGRLAQAAACYQESADRAREHASFLEYCMGRGLALLCLALDDSLPPLTLVAEAVAAANEWLQRRMSFPVVYSLACKVAAVAVTLARHGVTAVPAEVVRLMRRARWQAMAQRQQRSIYLAAEAALNLMRGHRAQALALFADAATTAANEGFLWQLLSVLRIAARVLPSADAAHDYYTQWLRRLQQNLMDQPSVQLRELESAIFPPAPSSGQPIGAVPR